jgi:hypothetical protein
MIFWNKRKILKGWRAKKHEKDGDNRTARPEGLAGVRLGAGVVFCLCSWVAV